MIRCYEKQTNKQGRKMTKVKKETKVTKVRKVKKVEPKTVKLKKCEKENLFVNTKEHAKSIKTAIGTPGTATEPKLLDTVIFDDVTNVAGEICSYDASPEDYENTKDVADVDTSLVEFEVFLAKYFDKLFDSLLENKVSARKESIISFLLGANVVMFMGLIVKLLF